MLDLAENSTYNLGEAIYIETRFRMVDIVDENLIDKI